MIHSIKKNQSAFFIYTAIAFLFFPFLTKAQQPQDVVSPVVRQLLSAVNVLVGVTFVLCVALFGWGVVKLIYASGDPTQIQKAKQFIWWGVIGLGIAAFIGGIVNFIAAYFGIAPGVRLIVNTPNIRP